MARRRYKHWERLDNTANLFPIIAGDTLTNTYRLSVTMSEPVDPAKLQEALNWVVPRFPGFNVRLRSGVFWYYFEENGKAAPKVHEENAFPCRFIHENKTNSYLFRVNYYKDRINLEVFHVLADGMGGMTFLRELVYKYIRLMHPEIEEKLGDSLSPETSLNREDSFVANYRSKSKSQYKAKKAFLIKGEHLAYDGFGVVSGYMPLAQVKKVAKEVYECSINEYLIACFIWATYRHYPTQITEKKPIRVAVPVNLRPYFNSITTKNFFAMVSAEFFPKEGEIFFADVVKAVKDSLREQINKENLEKIFSYNVSNEQYLAARAVPLPLKKIAIKLVYTKSALANTTTITNVGGLNLLPEYEPYVKMYTPYLSMSKGQELKGTIASFRDTLVYTYTSLWEDTSIQKGVFSQIALDGVDVTIETNGVYSE